jgi:hypothetical protein
MNAKEFYTQKTKHALQEDEGVRLTGEELFVLMEEYAQLRTPAKDQIIEKQDLLIKYLINLHYISGMSDVIEQEIKKKATLRLISKVESELSQLKLNNNKE